MHNVNTSHIKRQKQNGIILHKADENLDPLPANKPFPPLPCR